jgi:hypothetical protein
MIVASMVPAPGVKAGTYRNQAGYVHINLRSDPYQTMLANCGMIERGMNARATQENEQAFLQGVGVGAKTYDLAAKNRYDTKDSLAAAGLTTLLSAGAMAYFQANAREEEKKQAIEAEVRRIQAASADTLARASGIVSTMTTKYGWAAGEAGLDDFRSTQMRDLMQRRPRDPFLLTRNAGIRVKDEKVADMLRDARACVAAAEQIPGDSIYDAYRALFVGTGAQIARRAALDELSERAYVVPTPSAKEAIRLCLTAVDYYAKSGQVPDSTYFDLVRSLMYDNRYQEANFYACKITSLKNDSSYAYDYACIMSRLKNFDRAMEWLQWSFRCGRQNTTWPRKDPDLGPLREAKPREFNELLSPKWEWRITWNRMLGDSITLTNSSPFPLTNVTLDVTVTSSGNDDYSRRFTARFIAPGDDFSWDATITSRGDDAKDTAALSCDQTARP